MPGSFLGLDIASTALTAAQVLMDVAGQNIANDATPGYSRQVAEPTTTTPYAQPDRGGIYSPELGTGVQVQNIQRQRANYLDGLFRTTQTDVGLQSTREGYLSALQSSLNEPGQNGLSAAMNKFFSDFQTLSQDPQSSAARTTTQQDAEALTAQIQQIYQGLQDVGVQAQQKAAGDVQTVNGYLQQLANLNQTIATSQALGQQPNDLLDTRDNVLDKLSKLVPISFSNVVTMVGQNQVTQVTVTTPSASGGNVTLVSGASYGSLTLTPAASGAPQFTLQAQDAVSGTSSSIAPAGGSIGASYGFVNQDLNAGASGPPPSLMYQLNQAVSQLASQVNTQHAAGYYQDPTTGTWQTGLNFFTAQGGGAITAQNIEVNPLIQGNAAYIAAGATGNPGDGQNATAISDLGQASGGPVQQYGAFVANVGTQVNMAQNLQSTAQSLLSQVSSQRSQVAGVSINEEMTNLVQAQAMYTAAAKVAQMFNSSLQSLISAIQP